MKKEKKSKDILEGVKDFPRVTVGDDFLEKLHKRIAEYEAEKESAKKIIETPKGFFETILEKFRKPYLVPALGLIILCLIVLYFVFMNSEPSKDENKVNVIQKNDTIEKVSPEVKLQKDSSVKNEEKLEKKSQKEKTKSFITKKEEVEMQPQQIEQKNNVQEEKEIKKSYAINNEPSVESRDSTSDKEIAKDKESNETKITDVKINSLDDKLNLINKNSLEKLSEKVKSLK